MKTEKEENQTSDKLNLQPEALADLPVTDEQAEDAKGGTDRPTEQLSVNFTKVEFKYTP